MNNDTCIWYGECEKHGELPLNCPYNGTAKPLTDPNAIKVLETWCPDFLQKYSKGLFAKNFLIIISTQNIFFGTNIFLNIDIKLYFSIFNRELL